MRLMGDATHANVPQLAAVSGLQLVAGYDSGTPDIDWTAADWARFPGLPQVHIDQGYNSTLNTQAHAVAFDIEPGAYQPGQAAQLINVNETPRPTVYVNRSNLAATLASAQQSARFKGDVWLSYPGWRVGWPLPALPAGCFYVAVQNQLDVAGAYDLSLVLDPLWPIGGSLLTAYKAGSVHLLYSPSGQLQIAGVGQDDAVYLSDLNADLTASNTRQVSAPLTFA